MKPFHDSAITKRVLFATVAPVVRATALTGLSVLAACSAPDGLVPAATATKDSATLLRTYQASCVPCHGEGLGGAPKAGVADDWKPRVAKGMGQVRRNAIEGFQGGTGVMPAKGGRPDLSDEDVGSIVDYVVRLAGLPAQ